MFLPSSTLKRGFCITEHIVSLFNKSVRVCAGVGALAARRARGDHLSAGWPREARQRVPEDVQRAAQLVSQLQEHARTEQGSQRGFRRRATTVVRSLLQLAERSTYYISIFYDCPLCIYVLWNPGNQVLFFTGHLTLPCANLALLYYDKAICNAIQGIVFGQVYSEMSNLNE